MSPRFTDGFNHMEAIGNLNETSVGRVLVQKALLEWIQQGGEFVTATLGNKLQLPCFL